MSGRVDAARRAVRKVLRDARDRNKWRKIVRFRLWMPVALQILLVAALLWYTNARFPGFINGYNIEQILILAYEPTQGVDVGSRFDIYKALRTRTNSGTAMLVKSSDPIELAGLCDRVLVMSRGQIIEEIPGDELDELRITEAVVRGPGLSRAGRSPLGVAMPRGPSSNGGA